METEIDHLKEIYGVTVPLPEEDEFFLKHCPICGEEFATPDDVLYHLVESHGYSMFDAESLLESIEADLKGERDDWGKPDPDLI